MEIKEVIEKSIAKMTRIVAFPMRYRKVKTFLNEIEGLRNNDNDIIIVLLKGIGDAVYGLSCIESLKTHYNPDNIIVMGNSELKDFIESYPCVDKVITYDVNKGEYDKVKAYMDCERIKKIKGFDCIFNTDPYQKKSKEATAIEMLQEQVFHLDNNRKITYAPIIKMEVKAIPDFEKNSNRIVVINPYSNSVANMRMGIYEAIARKLTDKGFIPYTNLLEGQQTIPGTRELHCSLEELSVIVLQSAGVVSVRSGVLDMVVNTGTPIFAIYSNCTEKFRRIYDLQAWEGKSPIEQIDIDHISKKEFDVKFDDWMKTISK